MTIQDLEKALKKLKRDKPMIAHCGRGFLKMFLRQFLKDHYTWRNIMKCYRSGIVKTDFRGVYEITTQPW